MSGLKNYFFLINNFIDIGMIMGYVSSYILKFYVLIIINNEKAKLNFWEISNRTQTFSINSIYWLNAGNYMENLS